MLSSDDNESSLKSLWDVKVLFVQVLHGSKSLRNQSCKESMCEICKISTLFRFTNRLCTTVVLFGFLGIN